MTSLLGAIATVAFIVSLIALARPIPAVGLATRKRALLAMVASLIVIGAAADNTPPAGQSAAQTAPTKSGAPPGPKAPASALALLSSRGYESDSGGYWYVEGQ